MIYPEVEQSIALSMGPSIWWEAMIYPEVEQSIEPGTLCVLMNGILLGMNVEHWAMIMMVRTFLQCGWLHLP